MYCLYLNICKLFIVQNGKQKPKRDIETCTKANCLYLKEIHYQLRDQFTKSNVKKKTLDTDVKSIPALLKSKCLPVVKPGYNSQREIFLF